MVRAVLVLVTLVLVEPVAMRWSQSGGGVLLVPLELVVNAVDTKLVPVVVEVMGWVLEMVE